MILDCFGEGDHFELNKIETSGVQLKVFRFYFVAIATAQVI